MCDTRTMGCFGIMIPWIIVSKEDADVMEETDPSTFSLTIILPKDDSVQRLMHVLYDREKLKWIAQKRNILR
jgi:hypothetical protein